MTLDEIVAEWSADSKIDKLNLEEASLKTPELHAKYLGMLSTYKLKLQDAKFKQKRLMKDKWLWYNGKMSEEQIDQLGWNPDPFDGLKILKGDMEHYVEADPELVNSEAKIIYLQTVVETLKEIVDNIKWRHQTIKNLIENRKFEAGF